MKKLLYFVVWLFTTWKLYAENNDIFGVNKINPILQNGWDDLVSTADNILWYIIWLFYFIAVVVWIYGWFKILVSWWEEEKVKKWKNYLVYMIIWLVVIFLASIIVRWVIDVMTTQVV